MPIAPESRFPTTYSEPAQEYDWVFIYYMSYDNNLSPYGEIILHELSNGIIDSNVAVVVQADLLDMEGMRRISFSHVNGQLVREEQFLESEDSADEDEYKKYLEWVEKNWNAKNYAIVFLDHGGALNGMSFDEKPFKDPDKNVKFASSGKWLNAMKIGEICRHFHQATEKKVRLLFLQQCGRGSLENLYNFVDAANYIMASPVNVGAPNTYYTKMLESVIKNPDINGVELAEIIMREDQHYSIYTLINNSELQSLPSKLQDLFHAFKQAKEFPRIDSLTKVFQFDDEINYDLGAFLLNMKIANNNNKAISQAITTFTLWYEQKLIVKKIERKKGYAELSGVSIYIPLNKQQLQRYTFLPLYKQTDIGEMLKLILGKN